MDAWSPWTTDRKSTPGSRLVRSRMVTWPMTSCDLKRSSSWPHYLWGAISSQRCKIDAWWRWTIYSISGDESNGLVTDNVYCLVKIIEKDKEIIVLYNLKLNCLIFLSISLNSSLIIFIRTYTVNYRNALDRFRDRTNIILFYQNSSFKWKIYKTTITLVQ